MARARYGYCWNNSRKMEQEYYTVLKYNEAQPLFPV